MINSRSIAKLSPATTLSGHSDKYILQHLSPGYIDKAAACLANSFAQEPIVSKLNIPWDDFFRFARLFCQHTAHDNLSVIAKNSAGNIVGVLINEDVTPLLTAIQNFLQNNITIDPLQFLPSGIDDFLSHEKFIPVFAILDALDTKYVQYRIANNVTAKCLHTFMGSVEEQARGEKLLLHMMHRAHMQTKNCNFVYSIGEYTNYFSQVIGQMLGGEKITEIIYDEFVISDGKNKPFQGMNALFTEKCNKAALANHQSKNPTTSFTPLKNCAHSVELIQISINIAIRIYNKLYLN